MLYNCRACPVVDKFLICCNTLGFAQFNLMEFKQKDPNKYTEIIWGKSGGKPELKSEQQQAWLKAFSSQTQEFSYLIDEIEGSLPETLYNSTLFRNTPGIFERGNQRVKHYLDGDGYIYKFSFASDGQVYFDSKFVKTTEFIQETKANKFLYRSTFGNQKPGGFLSNLGDLSLKNPSNTNCPFHHKMTKF